MSDDVVALVGTRVAKFRKASGLTQEQLADQLSVAHETVSRMERGATAPSIKTLGRIARALGVSVRDLLAPERRASEADVAIDDLVSLLKRRRPQEIRLVRKLAASLLEFLDQDIERNTREKPVGKKRPRPQ